jgi:hypothetical protein
LCRLLFILVWVIMLFILILSAIEMNVILLKIIRFEDHCVGFR